MEITIRMKCHECNKLIDLIAFTTQLVTRFAVWMGRAVALSLVQMLITYITSGFKGWPDTVLASVANELHFECPMCQKQVCWEAAPEGEPLVMKEQQKSINAE